MEMEAGPKTVGRAIRAAVGMDRAAARARPRAAAAGNAAQAPEKSRAAAGKDPEKVERADKTFRKGHPCP